MSYDFNFRPTFRGRGGNNKIVTTDWIEEVLGNVPPSVSIYGAKGDGISNDTAALQAAFDGQSIVSLEPGKTYLVDPVTFSKAYGILLGNGATLKLREAAQSALAILNDSIIVRDLKVDCNGLDFAYAVNISKGCENTQIRGCELYNINSTAAAAALIRVRALCHGTIIEGNYLHDLRTTLVGRGVLVNATEGVSVDPADTVRGVKITNNRIENIERPEDGDGVVVQDFVPPVDVLIHGNTFRNCRKRGVKVQNDGVTVTDNLIELPYDAAASAVPYAGISLYGSRIVCSGNRVRGVASVAMIELGAAGAMTDITVSNNLCLSDAANRQPTMDGIMLPSTTPGLTRGVISGNVISGARHGVRVQNASKDIAISGNVISDLTGSVVVLDDNGGTPINNVAITGNTCRTVSNYWITTDGGAAPSGVTFSGNVGTANFGEFGSNFSPVAVANHSVVAQTTAKTGNYTVALTDDIVLMNGSSLTLSLRDPTLVSRGRVYRVKNLHSTTLTVNSQGASKTIDGAASVSLTQWARGAYVSDGTQWLSV